MMDEREKIYRQIQDMIEQLDNALNDLLTTVTENPETMKNAVKQLLKEQKEIPFCSVDIKKLQEQIDSETLIKILHHLSSVIFFDYYNHKLFFACEYTTLKQNIEYLINNFGKEPIKQVIDACGIIPQLDVAFMCENLINNQSLCTKKIPNITIKNTITLDNIRRFTTLLY